MRPIDASLFAVYSFKTPDGYDDDSYTAGVVRVLEDMDEAPTLDYKDLVPQGEWIETTYKSFIPTEQPENGLVVTHSHVGYRCSRCGRVEEKKEPFCHCGARMKGADT